MQSYHHFGVGQGRLADAEITRREEIAERHGAAFYWTAGNGGNCVCGHGHGLDRCPVKRYWFAVPSLGEPFDGAVERAVMAEVGGSPRRPVRPEPTEPAPAKRDLAAEATMTERYAMAAFRKLGVRPQQAKVEHYGPNLARVIVGGRVVTVERGEL